MSSQPQPGKLARLLAGLTTWVGRRPRLVLLGVSLWTVLAGSAAATRLEYHTQRNDLLDRDKPCQRRWQAYLDTFGDDDDMVVVAEGQDADDLRAALDAVADRLRERPDLFDRVFHRVDLRPLRDRALLHLSIDDLEAVAAHLEQMQPLLGPVAPLAWRMLSVESLLGSAARALAARESGRELSAAERSLLARLPAILSTAAAAVRDPQDYHNPWNLGPARGPDRDRAGAALAEPQYFFTPDGSLALLTCRPRKATGSFTPAREATAALRQILREVAADRPGVTLGLTGLPVLETDEMELSEADSTRAAWLALVGVALLYLVVYRGPRYPLLTLSSLVVGTVWALGWAAVTVGHLNILSAAFAVMLIGLGDYGVLWVARYDEARGRGERVADSLRSAALHAGPSIVTAALTTGLAFFAVMFADFKAVAELGWIAGWGILLCAVSCLLLVPALLTLVDSDPAADPAADMTTAPGRGGGRSGGGGSAELRSGPRSGVAAGSGASADGEASAGSGPGPGRSPSAGANGVKVAKVVGPPGWLPDLAGRPRHVLLIGAVCLLSAAVAALGLTYDHNLLNLQPRELDSVVWERKLIERTAGATWDALSIARSREEALDLKTRYEALPEVGKVVEVASLIPADQDRKLPVIRAIHTRLAGLPPADRLAVPVGSDPAGVLELAGRLRPLAAADTALSDALTDLVAAVTTTPEAADRLRSFDRRLAADLAAELHALRSVSRPAPVTTADLPAELRERYVGSGGEFLVRATARESLWDYDALRRFTTAAATVDPEATGKSFRTLEGLRQMKRGFEWAAVYALAAIVGVLLLDLRRPGAVLLGLFPVATGLVLTAGVMAVWGIPLNPANMIALPLILGVGVDNGVHVLHDFRSRLVGRPYRLGVATGRGILVAGLTTVLGFGTLMTARHSGLASLGLTLTLGVLSCMTAALLLLPALLRLIDLRGSRSPMVIAFPLRTASRPPGTARAA